MKLIRIFLFIAGIVLFITATAKIFSAFGQARILDRDDPLFQVSYRHFFTFFGMLELAISFYCTFGKNIVLRAALLAWLATSFIIYRASMLWVGYHRLCPCLGNLTDALHIPPNYADNLVKIILAFLLVGSYSSLFWIWRQKTKAIC